MQNKKGFTLVELLAVIVILAIILAIAIPGISGIVESAKKGAFESDAKMLITGLNYQKLQEGIGSSDITFATYTNGTASTGTALTSGDLAKIGADSNNYVKVYIDKTDPMTICVDSAAGSKFGAYSATATASAVTYLTPAGTTCASTRP